MYFSVLSHLNLDLKGLNHLRKTDKTDRNEVNNREQILFVTAV